MAPDSRQRDGGDPAGTNIHDLFALLEERFTHRLPSLLGVALRTWAGETCQVEVATVTVLRCAQPAVFQAIVNSPKLSRYLRGQLAPDILWWTRSRSRR